ncbi:MAG: HAMP domain-containing histidine kinase, partial [Muribaculaceae bacterium]|nr:HAMP domain-containing histidine kinase [Muribaculaceae bacterium]
TYNNILKCGEVLDGAQIDSCYARLKEIAKRTPRIGNNKRLQQRTEIFYLVAKKRYADVLPLLKTELASLSNGSTSYSYFVDALIEAARATGAKADLLMGLQLKNKLLKERNATKSDINLKELLTIYEVENIKEQNIGLINENERIGVDGHRQSLVWMFVAALVVICLIVWVITMYLHSRWIGKRLIAAKSKLVEERNNIKDTYARLVRIRDQAAAADRVKNDFVENMSKEIKVPLSAIVEYSHLIGDFAAEDERPYIREYGDIMAVNTDLMIRLVNDLLDLPQLESGELSINRTSSSANAICNFALKLVKKHVSPDVEIIFANSGQPDSVIVTDSQRVEQVLIQLLSNAAKFTVSGSITLGYSFNSKHDRIMFTVTDTGIGVPRGAEERIFKRFFKIDPTTQGNGLGLYIGRLLAKMLGGTLKLDSKYRAGARFIFTVPI